MRTVFYRLCLIFIPAFFILFISNNTFAQDNTVLELKKSSSRDIKRQKIDSGKVWKTAGTFGLNLGQGNQSNWSAGGDDFSFSINSYLGLQAFYKKDRYSWDNTLDLNYGMVNTTSLGTRKNDDRIDFLSKLGYEMNPKLNLTGLFNFHSQFSKGFEYSGTEAKGLLSNFMSPGYFLLSVGLDYKPVEGLSIFASPLTARWTVVNDDSLSAKGAYGVDSGKHLITALGAFASITYLKDLSKSIKYSGRVDLFSNYCHNPENVDIMMKNMFTAQVSKILAASLGLDLIYDDDVKLFGPEKNSPGLQLKSIIAVGLNVKF